MVWEAVKVEYEMLEKWDLVARVAVVRF